MTLDDGENIWIVYWLIYIRQHCSRWRGFKLEITRWFRQVMLSIVTSWLICAILTATNVLPPTPGRWGYEARTDTRKDSLQDTPWFRIPYPGEQNGYINKCISLVDKDVDHLIMLARCQNNESSL